MGYVHAKIELSNPRQPDLKPIPVEALADTGALMLCIPEHLALHSTFSRNPNEKSPSPMVDR